VSSSTGSGVGSTVGDSFVFGAASSIVAVGLGLAVTSGVGSGPSPPDNAAIATMTTRLAAGMITRFLRYHGRSWRVSSVVGGGSWRGRLDTLVRDLGMQRYVRSTDNRPSI